MPPALTEQPVLVFVHGGVHTGACWDETIDAITAVRPDIESLVIDWPGRRAVAGDLATLTIEGCVASVCEQIRQHLEAEQNRRITLVGHSLAGVILPGVVQKLGAHCVEQVIFVASCIPPPGQCVIDTLPFGLKRVARYLAHRSPVFATPWAVQHFFFGNGATRRQRQRMREHLCSEASTLLSEVPVALVPDSVRTSWVLTARDRALPPALQRKFIDNLGGVDEAAVIDAGHEAMFTHPHELAETITRLVT
ncbi:alpha/beta hydrolase [Mycobacterium branderi]|uniref:Alpha/beta hydrolase n=1 Tax=Mycobacterium branderi TaxID=43348 RepID=A0A7I7WHY8_9MYCO|nr:alpha/beta hydrolase [Mycobacterium branderi]BBZ15488.1 hypothetical protein MBRA_56830 [Mycobacterium branderi]